jgi:hypothetical protein
MATGEICQRWKDEIAAQAFFPLCPELHRSAFFGDWQAKIKSKLVSTLAAFTRKQRIGKCVVA